MKLRSGNLIRNAVLDRTLVLQSVSLIVGTVAIRDMDGPTHRHSRQDPKGLRFPARSDRPPDAGFTGTGSLRT